MSSHSKRSAPRRCGRARSTPPGVPASAGEAPPSVDVTDRYENGVCFRLRVEPVPACPTYSVFVWDILPGLYEVRDSGLQWLRQTLDAMIGTRPGLPFVRVTRREIVGLVPSGAVPSLVRLMDTLLSDPRYIAVLKLDPAPATSRPG